MAPTRSSLAETGRGEGAAAADAPDLSPRGAEDGTERRRNLMKSLDSRAGMALAASLLADEGCGEGRRPRIGPRRSPAFLRSGKRDGEGGTEGRNRGALAGEA
jgi:hypothetical protein